VAQGVGPEFKPQYHKKKKKNFPGWPRTTILTISASEVSRIYRCEPPVPSLFLQFFDTSEIISNENFKIKLLLNK
jgi:hypothetical protein